jgi:hypothetical protein
MRKKTEHQQGGSVEQNFMSNYPSAVLTPLTNHTLGLTWLSPRSNWALMVALPPPWNSWSLDKQFFGSLCRWTIQNPGNSLTQVLDKIINGINTTKDLRSLIPDAPLPAQSLVEALLSLLKLGIVSFSVIAPRLPVISTSF